MARAEIKIDSILGGMAPSKYFVGENQYLRSIAIDPDFSLGSEIKTSGAIVPTRYEKFSSTEIASNPMWCLNTTKNTNTYIYQSDGSVTSYDSSLGSETDVGTPTSGAGNGGAYYNNYIYFATPTDVSRYGPLNGSPSLVNTVWTGATLGSQTALTNTTYPTIRGVSIPNHAMHVHSDATLYMCDFKDGQGLIHRISTKKTTAEGDTDDSTIPSQYNVLDLPWGYYPTDIESYGTDIVISAIQTTDSTVMQGKGALFFWDTTSASFYRQVPVADPLVTALLNVNGILYIFSGNAQKGCRVSQYAGGDSVIQVGFLEEGNPPFAGAVESWANRIYFGSWVSKPEAAACVFAIGSKNEFLPQGFHNVIRSTASGASKNVTCLKHVLQADNITPQFVVGWGDGSAYGLDKKSSSATYDSIIQFPFFNIGKQFKIEKLQIPLTNAVGANMSITPKIYVDDNLSSGTALTVINNTNFPNSERNIVYKQPSNEFNPKHNMMLELAFAGTAELGVTFPITILVDILDDE